MLVLLFLFSRLVEKRVDLEVWAWCSLRFQDVTVQSDRLLLSVRNETPSQDCCEAQFSDSIARGCRRLLLQLFQFFLQDHLLLLLG
jgi:hypothetical protein